MRSRPTLSPLRPRHSLCRAPRARRCQGVTARCCCRRRQRLSRCVPHPPAREALRMACEGEGRPPFGCFLDGGGARARSSACAGDAVASDAGCFWRRAVPGERRALHVPRGRVAPSSAMGHRHRQPFFPRASQHPHAPLPTMLGYRTSQTPIWFRLRTQMLLLRDLPRFQDSCRHPQGLPKGMHPLPVLLWFQEAPSIPGS